MGLTENLRFLVIHAGLAEADPIEPSSGAAIVLNPGVNMDAVTWLSRVKKANRVSPQGWLHTAGKT